jgi:hypothetical protein
MDDLYLVLQIINFDRKIADALAKATIVCLEMLDSQYLLLKQLDVAETELMNQLHLPELFIKAAKICLHLYVHALQLFLALGSL